MAELYDFILDSNYDLQIEDGDFKVGYSNNQEIEFILKTMPSEYYQWPKLGFGIEQYRNSSIYIPQIKNEIGKNLRDDNFSISKLVVKEIDGGLDIRVTAKRKG